MSSKEPSDLLDLERDIPTSSEDIRALREHRPRVGPEWLSQLTRMTKLVPNAQEILSRRPTFEGYEPFEL